jgi:hypothetical protein
LAKLTFEVVEPPKKGHCGEAKEMVKWIVDNKGTGWIVQHVKMTGKRVNCAGSKVKLVGIDNPEYWEAWRVKGGTVFIGDTAKENPKVSDTFYTADQDSSEGNAKVWGEAKFLDAPNLPKAAWTHDQIPEAGSLPATADKPAGWDSTNCVDHELTSKWRCCKGEESTEVGGTDTPRPQAEPVKSVRSVVKNCRRCPPGAR